MNKLYIFNEFVLHLKLFRAKFDEPFQFRLTALSCQGPQNRLSIKIKSIFYYILHNKISINYGSNNYIFYTEI